MCGYFDGDVFVFIVFVIVEVDVVGECFGGGFCVGGDFE